MPRDVTDATAAESQSDEAAVACDVVLAKHYGPEQFDPATLQRQRLAWSHAMARRQSHRRQDETDSKGVLAIDLLLSHPRI